MKLLKPIKGEEWIEEFREQEFWIERRYAGAPLPFYSRLTKSYFGWWCYIHIRSLWFKAGLLIDPLSCGGLWAHIRCFLFNVLVVGLWWRVKDEIWILFHREEWEYECQVLDAAAQARREGYEDSAPPPPGFEKMNFNGVILGERYFKRVAEILRQNELKKH